MRIAFSEIGEGIKIALAALKANKLRAILTTLGIFIGVLVVTVVISIIQGLNKYMSNEFSSLGADTAFISRFPLIVTSNEEYMKLVKRRKIRYKHYQYIKLKATTPEYIAPVIESRKNIKYQNKSLERVRIKGTLPDYMYTANSMPEFGRFFTLFEANHRRNVCVIGSDVVKELFPISNPIAKRIKIGGHNFLVIGILEEQGKTFGRSNDNVVIIPFLSFQKIFGSSRDIYIHVKPNDPEMLDPMMSELEGILRQARNLNASQKNDFSISPNSQLMDTYNQLTRTLWIVLIGIGSIALLVGGIGIMNIMLVSVTERTREIGIRKAVGARRSVIMLQFLVESMFISAIGVTLGILVSILLAKIIGPAIKMPIDISMWTLFLGIGFTVGIGTFFGLYPASKAAKLDPIVALHYE